MITVILNKVHINSLRNLEKGVRFEKGFTPWNKGTAKMVCGVCKTCGVSFTKRNRNRPTNFCSIICSVKNLHRPEIIEKRAKTQTGIIRGEDFRKARAGENCPFWKGGITPENFKIRNSQDYRNWRKSVFERDNYTCQECGKEKCKINADHIKPFSLFPELRLDINNGRTLCIECHKNTDTYGRKLSGITREMICQTQ